MAEHHISTSHGSGAMDETIVPRCQCNLAQIALHLSAPGEGDVVVSIDSAQSSANDIVLLTQDVSGATDFPISLNWKVRRGDTIRFTWPNATNVTWGLEVAYEALAS